MYSTEPTHILKVAPSLQCRLQLNYDPGDGAASTRSDKAFKKKYLPLGESCPVPMESSLIDVWRQCECRIVHRESSIETPDILSGKEDWLSQVESLLDPDIRLQPLDVFKYNIVSKVVKYLLSFKHSEGDSQKRELRVEEMQDRLVPLKYKYILESQPGNKSTENTAETTMKATIDWALGISLSPGAKNHLFRRNLNKKRLNLLSGEENPHIPMFMYIVVWRPEEGSSNESRHKSRTESLDRLVQWSYAEFYKRRENGMPLHFPALLLHVDGDDWLMYAASADVDNDTKDLHVYVWGSLLLGSTTDERSALTLMANLVDFSAWGQEHWAKWFEGYLKGEQP